MPPPVPKPFSRVAERMIADLRGFADETPARMRRRPTRELAGLVEELLIKHQVGRPSVEQTIRDHWPELVGAPNAAYSHAAQLDPRGKLAVLVTHSVVRNELFLNREMILDRIRALPGCSGVRSLQFRSG
jgi:hypothetical protein